MLYLISVLFEPNKNKNYFIYIHRRYKTTTTKKKKLKNEIFYHLLFHTSCIQLSYEWMNECIIIVYIYYLLN